MPLALSCVKEQAGQKIPAGGGIVFDVSVEQTKVFTDMSLNTVFEEGDAIGVFAVQRPVMAEQAYPAADGNYAQNVKYVRDASGAWVPETEEDVIYCPHDGILDVYAYYPYQEGADPTNIEYDASEGSYDLMTARAVAVFDTDKPVSLVFEHKLALVQAEVIALESLLSEVSVDMVNVLTGASLDLSAEEQDEELEVDGNSKGEVEMPVDSKAAVMRCYVPAQEIPYNPIMFTVTDKEGEYAYQTEGVTLSAGEARSYSITTYGNASSVSPLELSNCYIVPPGDAIMISAEKAFAVWADNELLASQGADMSGELSADLVWQDEQGLIPTVEIIDNGSVRGIKVGTNPASEGGNAVVALYVDGIIRWSWHIWVTDFNPDAGSNQSSNNGFVIMNRNLGAVTDDRADVRSVGMYYQFGRKDPFTGVASFEDLGLRPWYNIRNVEVPLSRSSNQTAAVDNLVYSINNPQIFIAGQDTDVGTNDNTLDWWSNNTEELGEDRWIAEDGGKTIFDPCPEGWRVPAFTDAESSPWYGAEATVVEEGTGVEFSGLGFYPFGSMRHSNDGLIYYFSKSSAHFWSANLIVPEDPSQMHRYSYNTEISNFTGFSINLAATGTPSGTGCNIRCVKDL